MPSLTQHTPTVIVVGSGLAGLSAASAALRSNVGAVILLERATKPGGNSIKASSGISAAPTRFQALARPQIQSLPDTMFFQDTVKSAGTRLSLVEPERTRRKALISLLTEHSASALDFLADDIGVDLSLVTQLGGHSIRRTHRGSGKTPPGADIVTKLLAHLHQDSRFELKTGCEVTRILTTPSAQLPTEHTIVTGVEFHPADHSAELSTIMGPVVFATGGFAGDAQGMLAQYRPDLAGLPSTNDPRPGAHTLLTAVGAQLVDMDSVQVHPTGFVDPATPAYPLKFLAAEVLRGEGAILLRDGSRFVNELATREYISNVIMGSNSSHHDETPRQWDVQILLDPGTCSAAASHVSFYAWKGLLTRKRIIDLDDTTRQTIQHYSSIVAGHTQDPLGRTSFGHWSLHGDPEDNNQEVCIGHVTPVTHFTMGGIIIDRTARVLSSSLASRVQRPIPGLWAAGEVAGGIHGDNRLGGSSLLECVVFGRLAGQGAATLACQDSDRAVVA